MIPSIHVRDVSYTYPDGFSAIHNISLDISGGESVALVGANGAGKSTFLQLLLGLLLPTSGEICIGDTPITKKTLSLIRQQMGLVFQDPDDQLFMPTVYEDVAFGPRNSKLEEKEVEQRVLQALDTVGILHLKDRAPYKLSGGEKRAAAIASVLSMQPEILIMDEPTSALDPQSRRKLMHLLEELPHTKLIATHDLDMAYMLCERTIVVQSGRITADGPTKELLADTALMEASGLEIPLRLQGCPKCGYR